MLYANSIVWQGSVNFFPGGIDEQRQLASLLGEIEQRLSGAVQRLLQVAYER